MSNPYFYYYPDEDGTLEVIDFGEAVSDIQEKPVTEAADAVNGYGQRFRSHYFTGRRVRIILERHFQSGVLGMAELERDFQALENHLRRGGSVGFSRDHAKSWCSKAIADRGSTIVYRSANLFAAWSAAADVVAGDEIVIESMAPESRHEVQKVSSLTTYQISLSRALRYTFNRPSSGPPSISLVRYRDFYPVLRLPADQLDKPLTTHDKRITFTFDAMLEYDPIWAIGVKEEDSALALPSITSGAGLSSGGLVSIDTLIANNATLTSNWYGGRGYGTGR